ncbi:Ribosomal RNA-processing protein 7, partial [Entomortierella chlamydospora]
MVSKKSKKSEESSTSSAQLDQIANFYILPLHMPAISTTHSSPTYKNVLHYLYFKKHESPKQDAKTPKDRTLFLLNIPVDATESHIRDLLKPYGRVASIHFLNRVRDSNLSKEEREQQEELERLEREAEAAEEAQNNKTKKGSKKQQQQQQQQQQQATGAEDTQRRKLFATGSQAYVVFLEEQELVKALNMKKKKRSWIVTGPEATLADAAKLSSLGVA